MRVLYPPPTSLILDKFQNTGQNRIQCVHFNLPSLQILRFQNVKPDADEQYTNGSGVPADVVRRDLVIETVLDVSYVA